MSVLGNRDNPQRFSIQAMVVPHHAANTVYLNSVFTASSISVIQIVSNAAAVALLRGEGYNKGFQFVCNGLAEEKTSSRVFTFIMKIWLKNVFTKMHTWNVKIRLETVLWALSHIWEESCVTKIRTLLLKFKSL